LLLVLLVIVVLVILSLMFGGFQKGTKSSGLGPLRVPAVALASHFPAATWPGLFMTT